MKPIYLSASVLALALITACQPSAEDKIPAVKDEAVSVPAPNKVAMDGKVRLRLQTPVSEPRACILPIRIENGLSDITRVTMIGFDLTGSGNDAKGNMFAPPAAPGDMSEARVIVEGQSCDAFDTLTVPEIRCTSGEENCAPKVELIGGHGLQVSQAG